MILDARQVFDRAMSEAAFQAQLRQLAALLGWEWYHPYDSRRSRGGWPDAALWRPRDGRLVLAELKRMTEQPSPEQCEVLEGLQACHRVQTFLWRPSDLDGEIPAVLR